MARKKNYDADAKVNSLDEYRSLPDGDAELMQTHSGDELDLASAGGPGDDSVRGYNQDGVPFPKDSSEPVSSPGYSEPSTVVVAKKTRRPLLSSEVNKAERALQKFDDRVRAFHATALRHTAELQTERDEFIAALPEPVRTSLRLMGLVN